MFRYFDFSKVVRGKKTAHKPMWAHYSQRRQCALMLSFCVCVCVCVVDVTRKALNSRDDVFLPQVLMLSSRGTHTLFYCSFRKHRRTCERSERKRASADREKGNHPPLPPCTGGQ